MHPPKQTVDNQGFQEEVSQGHAAQLTLEGSEEMTTRRGRFSDGDGSDAAPHRVNARRPRRADRWRGFQVLISRRSNLHVCPETQREKRVSSHEAPECGAPLHRRARHRKFGARLSHALSESTVGIKNIYRKVMLTICNTDLLTVCIEVLFNTDQSKHSAK